MKYIIDENVVNSSNISLLELFAALTVRLSEDHNNVFKEMLQKEIIVKTEDNSYVVTPRYNDIIDSILLDSESSNSKRENDYLDTLAVELMNVFDKGRKRNRDGTLSPYYFKCNKREVVLKLKKFFKLYGNKYSKEQIINAAFRYVNSFNGDYTYMRLLKYFIYKNDSKIDADGSRYIEEVSELATLIENEGEGQREFDWTSELK